MPPGVSEPVFPSASPTRACQPSSAAKARPGAPVRSAASSNCRRWKLIVILRQTLMRNLGPPLSVKLFCYLFEGSPLQQSHLGGCLSVFQVGKDAERLG